MSDIPTQSDDAGDGGEDLTLSHHTPADLIELHELLELDGQIGSGSDR